MDKEFHYDIIYVISQAIGLGNEDSYRIAYSSQFVDDNNKQYRIRYGEGYFINEISQSFDIKKPAKELEDMYVALHFLPTLEYVENRNDRLRSKFVTTPNNRVAQCMLQKACESKNPYLLGITLHAYADTWAHQNFSGKFEKFNCSQKFDVFEASLGHMDYMDSPDRVGNIWKDERLIDSAINNNERFIDAIRHIYNALVINLRVTPILEIEELIVQIQKVWSHNKNKRADKYIQLVAKITGEEGHQKYDKNEWCGSAISIEDEQFRGKSDFEESLWYGFQSALIDYKDIFKQVLDKENTGF